MNADDLREWGDKVERVRERLDTLFGDDPSRSPESEEHFRMALSHLELAARHIRLATYALMQKR